MMSKDFMPKVIVLEKTFDAFRSAGASAAGQAIFGAFLLLGLGFSPAQAETNILIPSGSFYKFHPFPIRKEY